MNIYQAISSVMADVGVVGKNDTNPQQKYKYRGIDAVMNALQPALIKNKVFVAPEILEQTREERQSSKGGTLIYSICKIKYTFYAEDGSSISAVVIGEGMDYGDKSTSKAMSTGFKYACFQVFCIPTEDFIDSETESPEITPKDAPKVIPIDAELMGKIRIELLRTGVTEETICKTYQINEITELTNITGESCLKKLKVTKDRESKNE